MMINDAQVLKYLLRRCDVVERVQNCATTSSGGLERTRRPGSRCESRRRWVFPSFPSPKLSHLSASLVLLSFRPTTESSSTYIQFGRRPLVFFRRPRFSINLVSTLISPPYDRRSLNEELEPRRRDEYTHMHTHARTHTWLHRDDVSSVVSHEEAIQSSRWTSACSKVVGARCSISRAFTSVD